MSEPAHDNSTDDVGSVPAFFREHSEFLDSLTQVADSAGNVESWTQDSAPTSEQELLRGLCKTLDGYQEQPTCLDPYLERIVGQLMAVVREYVYAYHDSMDRQLPIPISTTRLDGVFELLYTLCKVRGYKIILQFFPHAVADVEPVFATLWRYSADLGTTGWPARYVLLIWLSLLAMVPFDIESIDSGIVEQPMIKDVDSNTTQPLIDRWITQGKLYLTRSGCEMEGAAVMLARLLSRKDAAARQPQFIEWAAREISDAARPAITGGSSGGLQIGSVLRINGALRVLCHLFSAMDSAESLAPQIPRLLDIFQLDAFGQNAVTRKLVAKAVQRLALLMLPAAPVAASRVHARPSVRANLDNYAAPVSASVEGLTSAGEDPAPDTEIPEDVECFVGILLQKLHDK
ncbi:hypothetical protein IWW55_004452, partial [Coemansia sp. RSA 2706]